MRTTRKNFWKPTFVLGLSIAATPILVNAQTRSLTSVNKDKSSNESELNDSVKDTKTSIAQFIEVMMKTGIDGDVSSILASVIGLGKAMPTKDQEIVINRGGTDIEKRACYVVYENIESTAPGLNEKRPVCAYIVKIKRSGLDKQMRYFRIDLNGKLEKVILSQSKYDEAGKIVRGSGVKFDQDINSPEVKKTFAAEMNFWLKDWLKKEKKSAEAKKTTASATSSEKTPAAAL